MSYDFYERMAYATENPECPLPFLVSRTSAPEEDRVCIFYGKKATEDLTWVK